MPSTRREQVDPFEVDEVRVVAIGTGLWVVALVVLLVLRGELAEQGREWWIWTCVVGVVLGVVGTVLVRRRQVRRRVERRRERRQERRRERGTRGRPQG